MDQKTMIDDLSERLKKLSQELRDLEQIVVLLKSFKRLGK